MQKIHSLQVKFFYLSCPQRFLVLELFPDSKILRVTKQKFELVVLKTDSLQQFVSNT